MLIPFAIEPEAYTAVAERDVADKKLCVKHLLEFWRDHGVLVVPQGDEWDEWVSKLDQHQRGLLIDAYKENGKFRRRHCEIGVEQVRWDTIRSPADVNRYATQLDIGMFILEPTRASEVGLPIPVTEPCEHPNGNGLLPEITLWHFANETCKIGELRDLAQKPISSDDDPEIIWEQRLRDYAEYSHQVVIADPYAVRGFSQDPQHCNGLKFLLKHLMDCERKTTGKSKLLVSVFSTYDRRALSDPGHNVADSLVNIKNNIEDFYSSKIVNSSVKRIRFHLSTDDTLHGRWLRFDNNVITLGHGLRVLEPSPRPQVDEPEFQLNYSEAASAGKKNIENTLKNKSRGLFETFTVPA